MHIGSVSKECSRMVAKFFGLWTTYGLLRSSGICTHCRLWMPSSGRYHLGIEHQTIDWYWCFNMWRYEVKQNYANGKFRSELALHILYLAVVAAWSLRMTYRRSDQFDTNGSYSEVVTFVLCLCSLVLNFRYTYVELRMLRDFHWNYFMSFWNYLDMAMIGLVYASIVLYFTDSHYRYNFISVAVLLVWFKLLFCESLFCIYADYSILSSSHWLISTDQQILECSKWVPLIKLVIRFIWPVLNCSCITSVTCVPDSYVIPNRLRSSSVSTGFVDFNFRLRERAIRSLSEGPWNGFFGEKILTDDHQEASLTVITVRSRNTLSATTPLHRYLCSLHSPWWLEATIQR